MHTIRSRTVPLVHSLHWGPYVMVFQHENVFALGLWVKCSCLCWLCWQRSGSTPPKRKEPLWVCWVCSWRCARSPHLPDVGTAELALIFLPIGFLGLSVAWLPCIVPLFFFQKDELLCCQPGFLFESSIPGSVLLNPLELVFSKLSWSWWEQV